ncbi:TPA: hypothetical protein O0828_001305, partial [Staphylococcus aureus]|nr:hypothetical protein [Staphylococcus aureus]
IQLNNINQINIKELIEKISDILEVNNPFLGKVFELVDISETSINTEDSELVEKIINDFQEKFENNNNGSEDDESRD